MPPDSYDNLDMPFPDIRWILHLEAGSSECVEEIVNALVGEHLRSSRCDFSVQARTGMTGQHFRDSLI
jgi:hypothetical protein